MNGPTSQDRPSASGRWKLLVEELLHSVTLRRELAAVEIAHDRRLLQRAALVGGIGLLAAVAGCTLLLQALARVLASTTSLGITAWTTLVGSLLLVPSLMLLVHTYRKTRAEFCGLQGSLSELHEDLIWLREWAESQPAPPDSSGGATQD